jgi:hypothetical protein
MPSVRLCSDRFADDARFEVENQIERAIPSASEAKQDPRGKVDSIRRGVYFGTIVRIMLSCSNSVAMPRKYLLSRLTRAGEAP